MPRPHPPRPVVPIDGLELERELLRKGVVRLAAGRECCSDCGRTPLTGEHVHVYAQDEAVCELCRPQRRSPPERSEPVRHSERGLTVRRTARAA